MNRSDPKCFFTHLIKTFIFWVLLSDTLLNHLVESRISPINPLFAMATAESVRAPQQGFIFPLALDLKSQEKQQKHPPIDISVLTPISCAGTGEQTG